MIAVATAACSDSVSSTDAPPTTAACAAHPVPSNGASKPNVVAVDGTGDRGVGLPATLTLPLIVHATHTGKQSFVVRGIDAAGDDTPALATALGKYDGTFAVGFVDACASPTVGLHVQTTGRWHLDIAEARNAPPFSRGVAGTGDSVFVYTGKATRASVSYTGNTAFNVTTFAARGPEVLAQAKGAYLGTVTLPAGPAFVAVIAGGAWTIRPS